MTSVTKVTRTRTDFVLSFMVGSFTVTYAFPLKELAEGASLARMMTMRTRQTIASSGGMIDARSLKLHAKDATHILRTHVEDYFKGARDAV